MSDGQRWVAVGIVTFMVAGLLLLSMGGAILAAPLTLPLMYLAASRHPTRGFRAAATILSALTIAEVVWALTYFVVHETQPWIWLLPGVGAAAVVAMSRRITTTSP